MANNPVDETTHKEEKKFVFKDSTFDVSKFTKNLNNFD
jgi:hypothetical protein